MTHFLCHFYMYFKLIWYNKFDGGSMKKSILILLISILIFCFTIKKVMI